MSQLRDSLHVLSPGDKAVPHAHSIITGRKSWKTLKGKTEAVWPPYLESALFEGLAKYQPSNPRATKSLGRFPNRNRYISEYIQKTTGKYRTPKQVGSRLQQLRDTCQGKELLHKLSSGVRRGSSEPTDEDTPPVSPIDANSPSDLSAQSRTIVSIDILPENYGYPSPYRSPSPIGQSEPRPIRVIDPTVTFTSRSPMMAYSSFSVLLDGKCVHTEAADLKLNQTNNSEGVFFYSTTLVPHFWDRLCKCSDPTRYTIMHDIVQHGEPSNAESSTSADQRVVLSVEYRFSYPDDPYPSPQLSPTDTVSSANSTLPSPTTYSFDFLSGYPGADVLQESSILPTNDFLTSASPSICYPDFSPASISAVMSPDLGLTSYTHFDSEIDNNAMSIPASSFLSNHYAS